MPAHKAAEPLSFGEPFEKLCGTITRANPRLLTLALVLLLSRLWGNTFNCSDESLAAVARYAYGGIWKAGWTVATGQGRFYQVLVYPLAQIPYVFDAFWFVNLCRILSTAFVFVSFLLALRRLFGEHLAFLATFCVTGLITTIYDYNPFHSQPLWFNAGFGIFLLAVYCFASKRRKVNALAPYLFFLACLFYEVFLLLAVLFGLVWLEMNPRSPETSVLRRVGELLRCMRSFLVAIVVYLACWGVFRHLYPSSYPGTELSLGPLGSMLETVWRFSVAGLATMPHRCGFDTGALALTLVCTVGFAANYREVLRRSAVTPRFLGIAVMSTVPLIFLPTVLYAFTDRYREWVRHRPYYVGSFYSAFFAAVAICLMLWFLAFILRSRRRLAQGLYLLAIAYFSSTAYSNHQRAASYFEHSRSRMARWTAVDGLIRHHPDVIRSVDSLYTDVLITREDPYRYWDYYTRAKSGVMPRVHFSAEPVPNAWNLYRDSDGAPVLFFLKDGRRVTVVRAVGG